MVDLARQIQLGRCNWVEQLDRCSWECAAVADVALAFVAVEDTTGKSSWENAAGRTCLISQAVVPRHMRRSESKATWLD